MNFRVGLATPFVVTVILLGAGLDTALAAKEDILLGDYIRRKQADDDRQINIRIERCGSEYCAVGDTYVSKWRATCSLLADVEFGLHCKMAGNRKDGEDTFKGENYLILEDGTNDLTYDYFDLVYESSGEAFSELFELERVVRRQAKDLVGKFTTEGVPETESMELEIEPCGQRYCAHGKTDLTRWLSTCTVNSESQNRLDCDTVGMNTRDSETFHGDSRYELHNDAGVLSYSFLDSDQSELDSGERPMFVRKRTKAIEKNDSTRGVSRADSTPDAAKQIAGARYYALLIGVQDYNPDSGIEDLDQPLNDARKLKKILESQYSFDEIQFLENPTRAEVFKALEQLGEKVLQGDSLLLFYAGHGHFDKRFDRGYWLLSDSVKEGRGTWFSNSDLQDYIRAIPSKHTLLISDACFSGGIIFKSRDAFGRADKDVQNLYKLRSRKAMTSGALETVPDKSMFMHFLTKRLVENEESFLPAFSLFSGFRKAVMQNSENAPQYGFINGTGGEGGDFIFKRR